MQYVIGIDIGTGSTKAVAISYAGKVLASSQFYYPVLSGPPAYIEQDAESIWQAFVAAVKEVAGKLSYLPAAISLSSCMHSLIVIDQDNKPLTNLITWADTRSEAIAEEIRCSAEAEDLYRVTGTPIHSMSPLCKIIWFERQAPEIFARAFKFISIKEFIWHRLFNVYQVDHSIASATGLFNIESFAWHKSSLALCRIHSNQLSEIVPTRYMRLITGSAAYLLGLPAGTPICIGASDGCLANVGSNAVKAGIAAVTIGTSGAVRIANTHPVYNYTSMTFNYVLDEENFICGGAVNNGGNILRWLFKVFFNIIEPSATDYKKLFSSVEQVAAGSDGLLFLPYVYGERAPVWDEKACGIFFGIKGHHGNGHFLRAAVEGVCYSLHTILQIVESSASPVTQINVSGGFIHSKTWMQILADITAKKICVIQTDDASSIGAAIFAMKAMGITADNLFFPSEDTVFTEPLANNSGVYSRYYRIFKSLYPPLQNSMHQLYNLNL